MENDLLEFIMPFGKHKGKEVGDIPITYLAWLQQEGTAGGTLKEILEVYEEEIYEDEPGYEATLREILR